MGFLADDFPNIALEWHPSLNGDVTPNTIMSGSNKKFWFLCKKGHIWKSKLGNRTYLNRGCPYCSNQKVFSGNCLETLFPSIALEWHPSLNNTVKPKDVIACSHKEYWFKCEKSHSYKSSLADRVLKGRGCPYCSNDKVCLDNCLETLFPNIALEWHPTINGDLTPKDVVPGSNKKFWFICSKGHFWAEKLYKRTCRNFGCPYCSNRKVCKENCLHTLYPDVSKLWHPTLNGESNPQNVISGSGKKYWFKCVNSHEWKARLSSLTNGGNRCPYCLFKTQEKVREIFQNFLRIPFPKLRPKFLGGQEYDGANEELKLAFEYDGEFHDKPHPKSKDPEKSLRKTKELDAKKDRLSRENGWTLIRIHHSKKDNLEEVIISELQRFSLM